MSELLRVLTEQDVDDDTLQEAANAAFAVLEARGVDTEGVAPVCHEAASDAGQRAIDQAVGADDPEMELVLSPIHDDSRRLRIREAVEPGIAWSLEEAEWTGCAWRPVGREPRRYPVGESARERGYSSASSVDASSSSSR